MKISTFIKISCSALLLFIVSCKSNETKKESVAKAESSRPNILLILCDDLGYSDVGFNGAKDIKTPELDRLASSGTIFSAGYVSHPFCGPSRAALMTGRYPHTISSQFNLPPNSETIGEGIPLEEPFISKVLQESGYRTGAVGKWHLGAVPKYHPNSRGFDDFYGFLGGGHKYFPEEYFAKYEKQKAAGSKVIFEYLLPLEHNGKEVRETEYLTDALSHEAVRFVKESAQDDQPFFLYLAYNAPHVPLEAKQEDLEKYSHIEDEKRRTYAAMVHAVDRGVGEVVESLKATGQYENTLIVFLSDNGGKLDYGGATNYPLKEGKGSAYEGGYRVPMFFHWPENVPAGQRFDHPVSAIDFYPTFAGLAGAAIPEGKILDGNDIWDDFQAGNAPHKGEMIYVLRHRTGYSDVGIRRDQWKALRVNQETWKLINIEEDISEEHDLSAEHPEILKELVDEGEKWSKTHMQPRWFHDEQTGIDWREADMPRFDETFKLEE
ncbi:sulfatase-like hydrolase/transferase [Flammeovirgaceae bacterium SG7u.111]|nr:sulfatase-like hydrolase/transferase [Flammeovirgaceae bacterium SG7u.132]WPO38657.1 sulfatase-like hydrolase/transferase [Flammeovirgaceae bacterium SG7u.111]